MITPSNKAAEMLKEQLLNKCLEVGIGFRILVSPDKSGSLTFAIKVDRQHQGDEVLHSGDVKLFLDPASAAQLRYYQLDYSDVSAGFFLNMTQGVEYGKN